MQRIARQVGGDRKVGDPHVLYFEAAIVSLQLRIEMLVVDQAIARPGEATHGAVLNEHLVRRGLDLLRRPAKRESSRIGAAARSAAHHVEGDAGLREGFEQTDLRRAKRAAAASDETDRGAFEEA